MKLIFNLLYLISILFMVFASDRSCQTTGPFCRDCVSTQSTQILVIPRPSLRINDVQIHEYKSKKPKRDKK